MEGYSTLIDSFHDVEFRSMRFPMIVVYENAKDYPGKFAARIFDVQEATPFVMIRDTLEEIRDEIPEEMVHMKRHPEDDPVIVEVYF